MEPMKPALDLPLKCCGMNAEDNSQVLQVPLHLPRVIGSYIETASDDELLQTNKNYSARNTDQTPKRKILWAV